MTTECASTVKPLDKLTAVNRFTLNDDHFTVITVSKSRVQLRRKDGEKFNIHRETLREYFYTKGKP